MNSRRCRRLACLAVVFLLQHFVERMYELMRALLIVGCPTVDFFPQQMEFVGDVEGSKDGESDSVDGVGGRGDGAHLGVDIVGELENVFGVRAAKVISLVEN